MWCSCDCNFFIKLLCTVILIFTVTINGIGNFIGVGDIIDDTRFCSCHTTTQPGTTEPFTTEPVTEPTATVPSTTRPTTTGIHTTECTASTTEAVMTKPAASTTAKPSTTVKPTTTAPPTIPGPTFAPVTIPTKPVTTQEPETQTQTTEIPTTQEQTTEIPTTQEQTTEIQTTQAPTTLPETTLPEKAVPQPNILVYDELYAVVVLLPEVAGADEIGMEITPDAQYTPDYNGYEGFMGLEPGQTYSITAYAVINGIKEVSNPVVFTTYANPTPPSPTVTSVTENTITIEPIEGCWYRVRTITNYVMVDWTESTVFENLRPSENYNIEVKYKANGYHAESMNATVISVKTLDAPTTTAAPTTTVTTTTTTTAVTAETKPSTTKATTTKGTTTRPVTTQGGPFVSSASQMALSVFGGSSIPTANGYQGTVIRNIDATSDGGYVACGVTSSDDGDFASVYDTSKKWLAPVSFVAKFSRAGTVEWVKLYGSADENITLYDIAVLDNGKIVAVGYVQSPSDFGVEGRIDAVVYTLSSAGATLSKKEYIGTGYDNFYCVSATASGYVVGGKTTSTDGAFAGVPGMSSIIINFDFDGNVIWKHYFSGSRGSSIEGVDVDKDGNIFIACVTTATDGEFAAFPELIGGYADTVIVKFNYAGVYQWHYVLASSGTDTFDSIAADNFGGCLVAGNYVLNSTVIPDGTLTGIHNCGDTDALAIRLNKNGERQWYKIVSGFYDDYITDAVCVDGGFAVTGYTDSANREFASIGNQGGTDGFVYFLTWNGTGADVLLQAGSSDDAASCLAYSAGNRELLIAGKTESSDGSFAEKNAYTPGSVGFVSRYKITVK